MFDWKKFLFLLMRQTDTWKKQKHKENIGYLYFLLS